MKKLYILLVVFFTFAGAQNDKFLTFPFEQSADVEITSAWYYSDYYDSDGVLHTCELHSPNGAIDYDEADIGGEVSFKVLAAADGVVEKITFSAPPYNYGNMVTLRHEVNGSIYFTKYAHLREDPRSIGLIDVGDDITRGQHIGWAGNTGGDYNMHLHFEVRLSSDNQGNAVDPYDKQSREDGYNCSTGLWSTPYPDPNDGIAGNMGPNHLWTTDPPSYYSSTPQSKIGLQENGNYNNTIITAYDNATSAGIDLGDPVSWGTDIDGNPMPDIVHVRGNWTMQMFYKANSGRVHDYSMIVYNPDMDESFVIHSGFWGYVDSNELWNTANPPTGNEFIDTDGYTKQYFDPVGQTGFYYLRWKDLSPNQSPIEYFTPFGSTPRNNVVISNGVGGPDLDIHHNQGIVGVTGQSMQLLNGSEYADFKVDDQGSMVGIAAFTVNGDTTIYINQNTTDPHLTYHGWTTPVYAGNNMNIQFTLSATTDNPVVSDTVRVYYSLPGGANMVLVGEWLDVNIDSGAEQVFATQDFTAPGVGTHESRIYLVKAGVEELISVSSGVDNPKNLYIEEQNPGNGIVKVGEFYPADSVVVIDSIYNFPVKLVETSGTSSINIADLRLTLHDTSGVAVHDLGNWYNISINADGYWQMYDDFVFPDTGTYKLGVRYTNDGVNWIYPESFLYQVTNPGPSNPKNIFVNDSVNHAPTEPTNLLVNGQSNPAELVDSIPYFSAVYHDVEYGTYSDYYQIQVSISKNDWSKPYWDSGKSIFDTLVYNNNRCMNISYNGPALDMNSVTYYWRIRFWDNDNAEGNWSTSVDSFKTLDDNFVSLRPNLMTELVSYWPLDEMSGTRFDSHSNNHLTSNNSVDYQTGHIGEYASHFYRKQSKYLSISDADQIGLDLEGDLSFALWVNKSTSYLQTVLGKWDENGQRSYKLMIGIDQGNWQLRFYTSDRYGKDNIHTWYDIPFTTNKWSFIVVTYDYDYSHLYIDGVLVGTTAGRNGPLGCRNSSVEFTIGSESGLYRAYFDGLIENVGIWSRALTSDEVLELYNNGDGLPYDSGSNSLNKTNSSDNRQPLVFTNSIPTKYSLHTNSPNPFNPTTVIKYDLPQDGKVRLVVYNILGQMVATLVDDFKKAGYHQVVWNGHNMPSGMYFYKLVTDNFVQTNKMLLIK